MKPKIIVIGAGLTGLLIAHKLKKAGFHVQILEARDRIGGRILTLQSANETPIEMGATWFGAKHKHLRQLLSELQIASFEQYMEGTAFFEPFSIAPPQPIEVPQDDPSFRIAGGTIQIIKTLAEHFNDDELLLNQVVTGIDFQHDLIRIKTDERVFEAEKIISTLPPELLVRSIHFEPALPDNLVEIAQQTHTWMQDSIKVGLVYEQAFWKERELSGTIFSNVGPITEFYDHSDYTNSKFALCGFVSPGFILLPKAERQEKVNQQLTRIFGEVATAYLRYEELIWPHEKYTKAAEANNNYPHQKNGHKIYEKAWYDGRFHIAGTETSSQFGGYMDGAVYSALSTTKRILDYA